MQEKNYNDWLEEFKHTIIDWENRYNMNHKEAVIKVCELIEELPFVPFKYKDKLKEDLKIWKN